MKIAIGICARNEEGTIITMLESLSCSLSKTKGYSFKIFICANGCSDQTVPLVQVWLRSNPLDGELIILEEGNLINSQREIINKSNLLGIENVIFLDADIVLDINCIHHLIKRLLSGTALVAYAVSIPQKRANPTLLEQSLNLYDTSTKNVFSKRKHLHGRTFIIKTKAWSIPETIPQLIADDIYLSFWFLRNFGEDSIKKVYDAKVYFNQITNYRDFYRSFKRRNIEINKCFALFPDFKNLPKDQINRQFSWSKLLSESFDHIFLWLFLLFLRRISKIHFKIESFFGIEKNNQWLPTITSKSKDKPLLVLIEGLDCSGKKTTARLLQKKLIDKGISCYINLGPLRSRVYRLLSRVVSIYSFPDSIRSMVYAFDGLGDRKWYLNFSTQVVIQVSSPMRNWSYAVVNKKFFRILIMKLIKSHIPKYDAIWYITVPYLVRLNRHESQVKLGENSDKLERRFPGHEFFNKMEDILTNLLTDMGGINKEFNSSNMTYGEITDYMSYYIQDKIKGNH